jgi:hypothetical protein
MLQLIYSDIGKTTRVLAVLLFDQSSVSLWLLPICIGKISSCTKMTALSVSLASKEQSSGNNKG